MSGAGYLSRSEAGPLIISVASRTASSCEFENREPTSGSFRGKEEAESRESGG